LNEGIRAWMAAQDQPHEKLDSLRRFYRLETLFNGALVVGVVTKSRPALLGGQEMHG
jgi:hypothetical protein